MALTSAAVSVDRKDPRFDTLKKGHNLRFPATEAEAVSRILLCASAEEAAVALQRVVSAGLRPTVRSGGHCYEDFVSNNPNGAILDLSLHKAVGQEENGGFYIAAGALLGDVYQSLYKRGGVTLPAGTCLHGGCGRAYLGRWIWVAVADAGSDGGLDYGDRYIDGDAEWEGSAVAGG